MTDRDRHIAVIGPVPPPVTGRTVVTERLLEELARSKLPYAFVNTAVPAGRAGHRAAGDRRCSDVALLRKVRRAVFLAKQTLRVWAASRRTATAYVSVDASPGTSFTVLYSLLARLVGAHVILHHHSYSYIAKATFGMRCLCRTAGGSALHVTPCAGMSGELRATYPRVRRTADLTNAFAIDPDLAAPPRAAVRDRLVLGHLSNLTVAKGTLTAIECFTELRRLGEPVELHIGGPILDPAVRRGIDSIAEQVGKSLRCDGRMEAAAKRAFYSAIDVFLLPTTFRHETQPLVVLEALAAGVPVIAYARACIPVLLEGGAGLAVAPQDDFRAAAVRQIVDWRQDPDTLQAASKAARRRFVQLQEQSQVELTALIDILEERTARLGRRWRSSEAADIDA